MEQLFELAALLGAALDPASQAQHLDALVGPVLASVQAMLAHAPALQAHAVEAGDTLAEKLVFLACSTKGSNRPQEHTEATYCRVFGAAVAVLGALPAHPAVRGKFTVVVHRMVPCVRREVLFAALAPALATLTAAPGPGLGADESKDLEILLPLLSQIMVHAGPEATPVLDPLLLPTLQRLIDDMAAATGDGGGDTAVPAAQVAATVGGMQRQYLLFIHSIAHNTPSLLASPINAPHLSAVLLQVATAITDVSDPVIKKLCISTIAGLIAAWLPSPPPAIDVPFFTAFLDEVAAAALGCVIAPSFRPKDANSSRIIGEAARLLWDLYSHGGDGFLARLTAVLPAQGFPADAAQRVAASLRGATSSGPVEKAVRDAVSAISRGGR